MNEAMIEKWNEKVSPEDIVYHLGDFSMSLNAVHDYGPRLNGEKHIICGNHDIIFPGKKSKAKYARNWDRYTKVYTDAGFIIENTQVNLNYGGRKFNLCHFPYTNLDPRWTDYLPIFHKDTWYLHGHSHSPPEFRLKRDKQLFDVGVDGNSFYPWDLDEIMEIINET